MNLSELHSISKFVELFDDPRFKGLIIYLREHPQPFTNKVVCEATALIRSEGAWQGWFEALKAAESLKNPPQGRKDTFTPKQPYATPPPPTQNA